MNADFSWRDVHLEIEPSTDWNVIVQFHPEVLSTQSEPFQGKLQSRELGLILTDQQTRGRGRQDRIWESPPGNFAGTLVIPYGEADRHPATSLSPLTAAVLLQSLGSWVHENRLKLRWPNDVYSDHGKLAGILLTLSHGELRIGLGLNCGRKPVVSDGRRKPSIIQEVAFKPFEPLIWLNRFLNMFCVGFEHWLNGDDQDWMNVWERSGPWSESFQLENGDVVQPVGIQKDGQLRVLKFGLPCILTSEELQ